MSHKKIFEVLPDGRQTSQKMFEVLDGGLETTVQDSQVRVGLGAFGVPRSGPMDKRSFELGNQLLGNNDSAAGLEIQFTGPKLRFFDETVIAVTGANNYPQINQKPVSLWHTLQVQPGDILSFGHATVGARTYVTFAGGIDVPPVMGSRSTFAQAGLGGFQGRKLERKDVIHTLIPSFPLHQLMGKSLPDEVIPEISHHWEVEVIQGPHDDWLTSEDIQQFLSYNWVVSSKSNRIGYRLEGPQFQFAENAHRKPPENGSHPSNKIDYGCPVGAVLFCGQTPTILLADCPSLTGYMTPFTVIEHSLRRVGQARPRDIINFKQVSLDEAVRKLREV
ncbi:MAG: biotin-dependent carboxyltransferase [Stigonema ocellatum SAG 48.90 = DSM 106950]|nr:biotin-dependent carboxyltransferase [Stigonema ocellatum SAG 48.90 = DSM 106950]